jgi:hypothetical protein
MKTKYLLPFVSIFFLFSFEFENKLYASDIDWSTDRPLTWEDFQGEVFRKSRYKAYSVSSISYKFTWHEQEDEIKVDLNAKAYFSTFLSWSKKRKRTPELLAHEQLNFDITELHCRYFKERVNKFKYTQNVKAEVDSIYKVVYSEMLNMHIKYADETALSKNQEEEKKWNQFISDELKRLEEYSN